MKKRIVLCADDYGQAPPISAAIIDLLKAGRLSAVSCMVTTPYWPEHAKWLLPFHPHTDIGLHFNLTENKDTLGALMLKASLRTLKRADIVAELNQQIDDFTNALGYLPAFIDGHQHVHQFPVIRDALIEVYDKRLKSGHPYIRLINATYFPGDTLTNIKKAIVQMMGSRELARLLTQHQIPHNTSFGGMYPFNQAKEYGHIFFRTINDISAGGLIMCHPGFEASDGRDPIAIAREYEYQYLASRHFLADCAASNVEISRFLLRLHKK